MPDWVRVEPDGQVESVTLGLVTVVVTKLPVPRRCEQVLTGCGSGFVLPPPPPPQAESKESEAASRQARILDIRRPYQ
ncbi:hypothetical protein GCM10010960_16190 [Arenimonas maotaiensis]|uniref:Uncharacterized protein n=1 Tax=Arenimonas maotaiensis TaxID=1446479 RepID=A0A917CR21_9GAMM|nr:hypothetical protein GCM10010960_16190 [Arenimonas maotaiensis]